jgi:hypothetical protein
MAVRTKGFSVLIAVFACAAVVLPSGYAARAAGGLPTLYVSYNMNCTFAVTDDSGKAITTIAPGTYQVQITTPVVFADVDLTGIYDMTACQSFVQFQITGPGVSISTTLQDGDEDYGVYSATFKPGSTYTASDLNQPSVAKLVFQAAASGSPVLPTSPVTGSTTGKGSSQSDLIGSKSNTGSSAATPSRGTLTASVSAIGKVTLSYQGRLVSSLKAGLYTVSVTDSSKKSGFVIQQSHKLATSVSSAPFTGKKSKTPDLSKGQWFFYPSFIGQKTYFIVTG